MAKLEFWSREKLLSARADAIRNHEASKQKRIEEELAWREHEAKFGKAGWKGDE